MSTYDTILARRSIRKFTPEPVTPAELRRLLEAAMAAPSGHNKQPWRFITVTGRETLNRLADMHRYAKMLYEAPLCIVVCAETESAFWPQDCAAATENILLAAVEMGLGAVWCGVHPHEHLAQPLREILSIPPEIAPFCLIAVGRPAEAKEPRTQWHDEFVHEEKW